MRQPLRAHSWKKDNGEWDQKTQWHNIVAFGPGFAELGQGELTTRAYDRNIQIASGQKTTDHVIQQLVVELKADTIRILGSSRDACENQKKPAHLAGRQLPLLYPQHCRQLARNRTTESGYACKF